MCGACSDVFSGFFSLSRLFIFNCMAIGKGLDRSRMVYFLLGAVSPAAIVTPSWVSMVCPAFDGVGDCGRFSHVVIIRSMKRKDE